jgi:hypothetical protein
LTLSKVGVGRSNHAMDGCLKNKTEKASSH